MCQRFCQLSSLESIEEAYRIDASAIRSHFKPNPNICVGEEALVISDDNPRIAQLFHFGFTSNWSKKPMQILNARSEGDRNRSNDPNYKGSKAIITSSIWRRSIRSNRCLIIADGFILGSQNKTAANPTFIFRRKFRRPFAMAGLWDEWINPFNGETIRSCAIITTPATPLVQLIPHHRCPLILSQNNERKWISRSMPLHAITPMLKPFDDYGFNGYSISHAIQNPSNKDRSILKPAKSQWIRSEYESIMTQKLELQGMGETTARRRKMKEDR